MLKLFISAFVFVNIVLVQSTSFEDTAFCLRGPTNWCESIQSAKRCGAFTHCLQTVWSKHDRYLTINKQDQTCDSCVKCIRGDTTQCPDLNLQLDEISQLYLAGLPVQTICQLAKGCGKAPVQVDVKQQFPGLISEECGLLHPRQWCDSVENARKCKQLEYCRNNIWKNMRPMTLGKQYEKSDSSCGFCIWIFNNLHEILQKNITEFNIEQYLKGACTLIPTKDEQKKCDDLIDQNLPEIYNFVRDSMDPGIICRVIKFCKDEHLVDKPIKKPSLFDYVSIKIINPESIVVKTPYNTNQNSKVPIFGSKTEVMVSKLVKSGGVGCEICSIVLSAAKYMLDNNKSEDAILNFVSKELCGRLGSLNDTCVEYVNTAGKEILAELVHGTDPSIICNKMGLCLKSQVTSKNTKRFFDINVKDSLNCTLCKTIMTQVKTMLANKQKESDILDYIRNNLCEKTGQYSEMCKTVVNVYGPVLLQLIANDINPTQICEIIGMCQKDSEKKVDNSPQCVLCEFVLTTLSNFISQNSSAAEVEKWLDYVCGTVMPQTIRAECKAFVDDYGPVVIALLVNQIKPDKICQFIGLCNKTEVVIHKPTTTTTAALTNTPQCAICEFVLTTLSTFISQNSSAAEVEKWLDYVCSSVMPVPIRNECKAFVDDYGPVVIALLVNQIKPDKICQFIGLCNKTKEIEKPSSLTIVQQSLKNGPQCVICEFVLTVLENYIGKNTTGPEVEKWLEYVCNTVMPQTIRNECKAFVDEYEPILIQLLVNQIQPDKVCQIIHLCDKNQKPTYTEAPKPTGVNPVYCTVCQYVVQYLKYEVERNNSKEAIEHALDTVCKLSPGNLRPQCESIVSTYGPYLIDMIIKYSDPQVVCEKIKLCSSQASSSTSQDIVKPVDLVPAVQIDQQHQVGGNQSFECTLCLYVAEILDNALKQNKTDQEIADELEKICNFFPSPIKDQCQSFLGEYATYVLQLLAADLDPNEVCTKLKLCKSFNEFLMSKDLRSVIRTFRRLHPSN